MGVNKDQAEKFNRLSSKEKEKAIKYASNGMDIDDALYEADEGGRLILKIIFVIVAVGGLIFGAYKLVKWILSGISAICPHTHLTHMRDDTFEEKGYFRCKLCGKEHEIYAVARVKERVEPTCQQTGYYIRVLSYPGFPEITYEKMEFLPKLQCKYGELLEEAVETTCYSDGHSAIYECSECHNPISHTIYPKLESCVYENVGYVAPTCYSEGQTGIDTCKYCGDENTTNEVIPIVPHFVLEENKTPQEANYNNAPHNIGPCIYCEQIVAIDFEGDPLLVEIFDYEIDKDNNVAKLTNYKGNQEEVLIPSSINGYPVKEIKASMFEGNTTLQSLIIAEGIEVIGDNAFKGCTSLKQIKIEGLDTNNAYGEIYFPNSLKTIGKNAFEGCITLRRIHFNNVSLVKEKAFADCINLKVVEFGNAESRLEKAAFINCNNIAFFKTPMHEESANIMVKNGYLYFDPDRKLSKEYFLEYFVGLLSSNYYSYNSGIADFNNKSFEEVMKVSDDGQCYYYRDSYFNYRLVSIDPITDHVVIPDGIDIIDYSAFVSMEGKIKSVVVPISVYKITNCPFYGDIKFYFMNDRPSCPLNHYEAVRDDLEYKATRFYYSETPYIYNYWYYDEDGNIVEVYCD